MNNQLYIKSIERCLSSSLATSHIFKDCAFVKSSVTFEKLDALGIPQLEISKIVENNHEITTASLVFSTTLPLSSPNGFYSYRLTLMNNKQLLIGTASRPYATCEEVSAHNSTPSSSNKSTYTISYTASHPPLSII